LAPIATLALPSHKGSLAQHEPEPLAVRLSKVFGGTEEGWLVQQAQYDLAQVRRDWMKLKKLELV
jgi:hypothetical protein